MVINLSKEHSLVSNWVAELRDVNIQSDRMRFRRNLERIGEVEHFDFIEDDDGGAVSHAGRASEAEPGAWLRTAVTTRTNVPSPSPRV